MSKTIFYNSDSETNSCIESNSSFKFVKENDKKSFVNEGTQTETKEIDDESSENDYEFLPEPENKNNNNFYLNKKRK